MASNAATAVAFIGVVEEGAFVVGELSDAGGLEVRRQVNEIVYGALNNSCEPMFSNVEDSVSVVASRLSRS
jgi:hypothetical protein